MEQFLDYMGTMRGGRRFVTLEEEQMLLATATGQFGLSLADAQLALQMGAQRHDLILESAVADETATFLQGRLRGGDMVARSDFRAAAGFFSARSGNSVPPAEAERRVRQIVLRNGWRPAPKGWLWGTTGWFDSIETPTASGGARGIAVVPAAGVTDPASSMAPVSAMSSNGPTPMDVVRSWAAALASRDVNRIVAHYAPDALLLATAEQSPLVGPAQISGYFRRLAGFDGLSVTFDEQLQQLQPQRTVVVSGLYTFFWRDPTTNQPVVTPARYTYGVQNGPGLNGRIVMHHSSSIPGGNV
jgi:hypothetical protein